MEFDRVSDRLNKSIPATVTNNGIVGEDGATIEAINPTGLKPLSGTKVWLEWREADDKYPAGYRIVAFT